MTGKFTFAMVAAAAAAGQAGVLAPFTSGDLGGSYLLDEAITGGVDLNSTGNVAFTAFEVKDLFNAGDEVSITGMAIPLWANSTAASNNTLNGTFTFTFYGLGGGSDANAFEGIASETLIGSATLDFTLQNTGVLVFGGLFDMPIDFIADSTGVAVHITSTAAFRMKLGPQPTSARRLNINTGASTTGIVGGSFGSLTIIGSAVPAPAASAAILGVAIAAGRRRR